MPVEVQEFDAEAKVSQFSISHSKGSLIVKVIDYGAIITNLFFPDNFGKQRDVVLGFDTLEGYKQKTNPYFGAVIGRVANRTGKGSFQLNGKKYQLAVNNGPNHLHGGLIGFDKKIWTLKNKGENSITLELISKDGDEGYPGTIKNTLIYTVTEDNSLILEYSSELIESQENLETIVNLTNHTYFNLNGCSTYEGISVHNHVVKMTTAKNFLEKDENLLPTGKVIQTISVDGMDFAEKEHSIGERIEQVKPNGYDHCYVIETDESKYNIKGGSQLLPIASVVSPITNIKLEFATTEPGFQFYTGNFISDEVYTKKTQTYHWPKLSLGKHSGCCFEAQRFPNAINHDKWKKQVVLAKNQKYSQKTLYKFSN